MRVAQVMAGGAAGGAETFFVSLAAGLARAGLAQRAFIRPHEQRVAALALAGVPVETMPFGSRLEWGTGLRLRRRLRAWGADIALAWMNRGALKCPTGPWVKAARLGGYYDLKYYRGCEHLVGNTPDIVDYLVREGWPAERASYIPNFCHVEDVQPADRAALGTPEDAPVVLALGRLHPVKAHDVLLQALLWLPGVWCWIAGDGPLRAELEAQAAKLGVDNRVRFLGWRQDRTALLLAADTCVLPSRYEPGATVVVEAWAHRRPIVAAASAGPAATIRDGIDGLVVPIDNARALGAALRGTLHEPQLAADLVAAGAERAEGEFSEAAVVAGYLELFEQIRR